MPILFFLISRNTNTTATSLPPPIAPFHHASSPPPQPQSPSPPSPSSPHTTWWRHFGLDCLWLEHIERTCIARSVFRFGHEQQRAHIVIILFCPIIVLNIVPLQSIRIVFLFFVHQQSWRRKQTTPSHSQTSTIDRRRVQTYTPIVILHEPCALREKKRRYRREYLRRHCRM